jgi:hypothetical protein
MNCPSADRILAAELEELPLADMHRLEHHAGGCERCRTSRRRVRELLDDLAAPELGGASSEAFVADVLARCAREPQFAEPRREQIRWPWLPAALGLAALLAISWFTTRPSQRPETWAARGTTSSGPDVYAQVLAVRGDTYQPVDGVTLRPGDGLAVRYWNTTSDTKYLLAFAIDATGTMHWIYPKYVDPSSDPESIAIAPTIAGRLLEEVVEPDTPADGVMQITVLITRRPLAVKMLEERVSAGGLTTPLSSETVNSQTWSALWLTR